jgi:diguanylate cyclase (GGDEF)-like protein
MSLQDAITSLQHAVAGPLQSAVEAVIKYALLDDMTPLGNSEALKLEASSVGKGGNAPNVVVFGDMNRLKALNDEFGHTTGSAAIGKVGELIKTVFVDECGAHAFRQSGDEFVLLLSSESLESFKVRVDRFTSCEFQIEDRTHTTSVSFGYAVSLAETDFATLYARAEVACQVAKSHGAGSYVEWSEEIERQIRDSARGRCDSCGASFEFSVPRQRGPHSRKASWCPACGRSFRSDESSTVERT